MACYAVLWIISLNELFSRYVHLWLTPARTLTILPSKADHNCVLTVYVSNVTSCSYHIYIYAWWPLAVLFVILLVLCMHYVTCFCYSYVRSFHFQVPDFYSFDNYHCYGIHSFEEKAMRYGQILYFRTCISITKPMQVHQVLSDF